MLHLLVFFYFCFICLFVRLHGENYVYNICPLVMAYAKTYPSASLSLLRFLVDSITLLKYSSLGCELDYIIVVRLIKVFSI